MNVVIPAAPTTDTTNFDEIDRAIRSLDTHRDRWTQTTIPQRLAYLQDCLDRTLAVAEAWTVAACNAKGIDPKSPLAGEEWIAGPISAVRNIRLLMTTLAAAGQLAPPKIWQRTHDAIVWGSTASEQQERKTANRPRLTKLITSELGCVTPILVVPGKWSKSDLIFQARQVASTVAHNASFNCVSGQVLVTASGWAQQAEFLAAVRQELAAIAPRQAYYPGAQDRYQAFLDQYPQSAALGARTAEIVPWTIIPDVPPIAGEYALTEEAFCGILAQVSIDATTAPDFLSKAVEFANDRVWGTLSCTVLIDTQTQKQYHQEFDSAIANLKYGAIGVNIWSAMIFYFGSNTWGAYPGNTLAEIGSGIGFVHNSYLFDCPQKSVVYAPFRIFPTPAWFANHKNLLGMARHLLKLEAYPTWQNLPRVVLAALQG